MISDVVLSALVQFALMVGVIAAYVLLARRFHLLWHPLSVVVAVGVVGVIVSVLGELWFRGGLNGVPAMLRRSAIGAFSWGVVVAMFVWSARRIFIWWRKAFKDAPP